ncbi:rhamnogalacturonate lyase [Abditibacteriota bacterium]|nr:rhamnogalacturonate lyase [Abditibacteriota bacterium]
MKYARTIITALAIGALFIGARASHAQNNSAPVSVTEDANNYTISNGIVTAKIVKRSGDLASLVYQDIESLDATSGHAGGYWSHSAVSPNTTNGITINPADNGGERGEVSIKGNSGGALMGAGPGGSTSADIEIRYALERGSSGLYTYSIFTHKPDYPATQIGEARYATKLNDSVFDWMTVDARRNMKMITAYDWNHGTRRNMKEARLMNTGIMKGQVEHKYDYSAVQYDIPAFGWSSSEKHVGFWMVNPTIEYLSGGPTKLELTAHRDATFTDSLTAPAVPTLLNYWRGSHYGGSRVEIAQGEAWTKVIGPFLLYCNSGPTPDAMWKDAFNQATKEAQKWPYSWVEGVDYPSKTERGTVSGQLALNDPLAPGAKMSNILVGLTFPDYPTADGRGVVDWQTDAKHYQFWVRGDAGGHFSIPSVRPGTYTLHAIADGVLGEFAKTEVSVGPGQSLDLGTLNWIPVRYGRQLWDIGIPNRTSGEFLHGDHASQWGLYNQYPKDFPNDVNFIIGKSDPGKDWNLMQVPRAHDDTGAGQGDATIWRVTFELPSTPKGKATLRLAFAGTETRSLGIAINDQPAGSITGLPNTSVIHRDSNRGLWFERDLSFDAKLMKAGTNVLKLTVPAGSVASGVQYDYLRLELDEAAQ